MEQRHPSPSRAGEGHRCLAATARNQTLAISAAHCCGHVSLSAGSAGLGRELHQHLPGVPGHRQPNFSQNMSGRGALGRRGHRGLSAMSPWRLHGVWCAVGVWPPSRSEHMAGGACVSLNSISRDESGGRGLLFPLAGVSGSGAGSPTPPWKCSGHLWKGCLTLATLWEGGDGEFGFGPASATPVREQ